MLNPKEIVVGDVLCVKGGDQAFADACLFECDARNGVMMDEAALTGESELVKKNVEQRDPFLLSSTVCATHGNAEDAKALVIGVGDFSQWGRIQANLDQEDVPTPLQDKLEDMVVLIGYLGTASATLTFVVTLIYIAVSDPSSQDWVNGIIAAFIIAVTIIVVAIPEGLPLAVTISLAYSTQAMLQDRNLVRSKAVRGRSEAPRSQARGETSCARSERLTPVSSCRPLVLPVRRCGAWRRARPWATPPTSARTRRAP